MASRPYEKGPAGTSFQAPSMESMGSDSIDSPTIRRKRALTPFLIMALSGYETNPKWQNQESFVPDRVVNKYRDVKITSENILDVNKEKKGSDPFYSLDIWFSTLF